jgi:hypothetical protein
MSSQLFLSPSLALFHYSTYPAGGSAVIPLSQIETHFNSTGLIKRIKFAKFPYSTAM